VLRRYRAVEQCIQIGLIYCKRHIGRGLSLERYPNHHFGKVKIPGGGGPAFVPAFSFAHCRRAAAASIRACPVCSSRSQSISIAHCGGFTSPRRQL
jgi:hypothetical protein